MTDRKQVYEVELSLPSIYGYQLLSCADAIGLTIKHHEQVHGGWILIVFNFLDDTELMKYKTLLRLVGIPTEYIETLKARG